MRRFSREVKKVKSREIRRREKDKRKLGKAVYTHKHIYIYIYIYMHSHVIIRTQDIGDHFDVEMMI